MNSFYAVASAASSIFFAVVMYYTLKKIKKDLDSVWNYLIFTQNTTIHFREKLEFELQDVREALGGKIEKNLLEVIKKRKELEKESTLKLTQEQILGIEKVSPEIAEKVKKLEELKKNYFNDCLKIVRG